MEPELFDQSSGRGPEVDGLGPLIAAHDRELRRIAVAVTGDPARAADAVAATWNAARRRRRSFATRAAARAWLLDRVARDAARRVRPSWLEPLTAHLKFRRRRPPDARPVLDQDLAEVLGRLTPEDRRMLALRHGVGLTSEEIAAQLHLTGAGIRTHLADLHHALREALAIGPQDDHGRPLTDREVEARIAGRLVAHLDARLDGGAAPSSGRPLPEIRPPVSVRLPGLPDPRRHPVLTTSLAVVLVVVIGVPVSLRVTGWNGVAAATPTPVPGTLVPLTGWSERTVTLSSPGSALAWSPDGRHVAVRVGDGSVAVYDSDAGLARSFPGGDFAWIDNERLAVMPEDTSHAVSPNDGKNVAVRQLDGRDELLLSTPAGAVGLLGGGGLAVELSVQQVPATGLIPHAFVILGPTGMSPPLTGVPVAWTPDGARLAYIRDATSVGPNLYGGSLSILDPATGETRDTGQDVRQLDSTAFDPTGRWLVVGASSSHMQTGSELALLDTVNGTLERSSIETTGAVTAWSADGSLVVDQSLTLLRWRPGDSPVAMRWQPALSARLVGLAPLGGLVAVALDGGPKQASAVAGTAPQLVVLPGQAAGPAIASPDGTQIAYTREPDRGRVLVLATLPAAAPSISARDSASPAPSRPAPTLAPPSPGASLDGMPLLPLTDALTANLGVDSQPYPGALWGPHLYLLSGFDQRQVQLSVLDLRTQALWMTNLLPGGLLPGEEIAGLQTDGAHLVVEVYRRLGPSSPDQSVPCPDDRRQPFAWRLLVAPLDADGRPADTFSVLDSATSSRARTFPGDLTCSYTGPPTMDLRNGRVAYDVEAPTRTNPWASRIVVRNMADGSLIESEPTTDPVDWIGLGEDLLAWVEERDGSASGGGTRQLRVQLPFGTTPRTVPLPSSSDATQSSFVVTGDRLAYSVIDYSSTEPGSLWLLDPATGATQPISVPSPSQSCWPIAGTTGVLFLECPNPRSLVVWRQASGLAMLDSRDTEYIAAMGGGWVLLLDDSSASARSVRAFPLSDVLR